MTDDDLYSTIRALREFLTAPLARRFDEIVTEFEKRLIAAHGEAVRLRREAEYAMVEDGEDVTEAHG